jgi:hypothetical protein
MFLTGMRSASCPNPQPGGPGYLFWCGLSPLTRPAWEALVVTYITAGMALRFILTRKRHHCDKVEIPAGQSAKNKQKMQWRIAHCNRNGHLSITPKVKPIIISVHMTRVLYEIFCLEYLPEHRGEVYRFHCGPLCIANTCTVNIEPPVF